MPSAGSGNPMSTFGPSMFLFAQGSPASLRPIAILLFLLSFVLNWPRAVAQISANQQATAQDRGVRVSGPDEKSNNPAWQKRKDYAPLFATNDYDTWQPLVNPVPDAEAIARELEQNYGFETELVKNPSKERILTKLREYLRKGYAETDQLLIFFAGHGLYDDLTAQGFIVARDSRADDENHGSYESYDDLRQIIDSIPAKHILLMLDACYSGTFDRRV